MLTLVRRGSLAAGHVIFTYVGNEPSLKTVSGISEEEKKEIVDHLDEIVDAHKIELSDDLFVVKAKKGMLFPLVVNVAALVVIGVSVVLLWLFFRQDDQQFRERRAVFATVENQLIRQLQAESRDQLQQKEREISEIQGRLRAVAMERNELLQSIEEQIREREETLRGRLDAELDAERRRLVQQGIAGRDLESRLSSYEEDRAIVVDRDLEAFRAQLETERRRLEEDMQRIQVEYDTQLSQLNAERAALVVSFQEREADLRRRLEMRTVALRESREAAEADVRAAQARLDELARQREAEESLNNQVSGHLARLRAAVRQNEYDEARESIAAFRSFIDPTEGVPIAYPRREIDLFMVDAIDRLIAAEGDARDEAASIAERLERLQNIGTHLDSAGTSLAALDEERAAASYRAALAEVSGLEAAHAFVVDREVGRTRREAQAIIGPLEALLETSEAENERYVQTIALLEDREATLEGEIAESRLEIDELRAAIADVDARLEESEAAAETLRNDRQRLANEVEQHLGRIARLQTDVESAAERSTQAAIEASAAAEARIVELNAALDIASGEIRDLRAERADYADRLRASRREADALQETVATLDGLQTRYREFVDRHSRVTMEDEAGLVESKFLLDTFVGSPEMSGVFPELLTRIRSYDRAFENAGYRSALLDITEILEDLSFFSEPAEQLEYLRERIEEGTDNGIRREMLVTLRDLVTLR